MGDKIMTNLELEQEILSEIITNNKYAKYDAEKQRRETWNEICDRNMQMHLDKFEHLGPIFARKIKQVYKDFVRTRLIVPSMRSFQFAGLPILLSPNRIYNCAYLPIDDTAAFSETMFLLLGGTGVGYSVQQHHVNQLPVVRQPSSRTYRYVIEDSIKGWAEAVRVLIDSYTGARKTTPRFDFTEIRPLGAPLKTTGGTAPGPDPLDKCLDLIQKMLKKMPDGHQMKPIEVHDMLCHIADSVLAGGIRRAAMISLFSADDDEMLMAKSGIWYEKHPHRGRANNSVVLLRHKLRKSFFMDIWKRIEMNKTGEPGFFLTNDKDWGTNPCAEISLRPFQMCNLCSVNASTIKSQDDLNARVSAASFLGTLQAAYTDFHYLREIWQENCEKDALLGVSLTGIGSNALAKLDLQEATNHIIDVNVQTVDAINEKSEKKMNYAARLTCIKPEGTTSCVLGTSSGIHSWHNDYYIRRVQVGVNEPIHDYLVKKFPTLMEKSLTEADISLLCVPQKAPKGAITRKDETAIDLLERIKYFFWHWIMPGHIDGNNAHNVSATVSVKEDEWGKVGEWMWKNRDSYNGITVIPYYGGSHPQLVFEDITKYRFEKMKEVLSKVHLYKIKEETDSTDLQGEIACGGGSCDIL
jgi:ribonucleoside-diphosphate reductase alpha chain